VQQLFDARLDILSVSPQCILQERLRDGDEAAVRGATWNNLHRFLELNNARGQADRVSRGRSFRPSITAKKRS